MQYCAFWHYEAKVLEPLVKKYNSGFFHREVPQSAMLVEEERADELLEDLEKLQPGKWVQHPVHGAIYNLDTFWVIQENEIRYSYDPRTLNEVLPDGLVEFYDLNCRDWGNKTTDYRCPIVLHYGGGNTTNTDGQPHIPTVLHMYRAIYFNPAVAHEWLIPNFLAWVPSQMHLVITVDPYQASVTGPFYKSMLPDLHEHLWAMLEKGRHPWSTEKLLGHRLSAERRGLLSDIRDRKRQASEAFANYKAHIEAINNLSNTMESEERFNARVANAAKHYQSLASWAFIDGAPIIDGESFKLSSADVKIGRIKTAINIFFHKNAVEVAFTNEKVAPCLESDVWQKIGRKTDGIQHTVERAEDVLKLIESLSEKDVECLRT